MYILIAIITIAVVLIVLGSLYTVFKQKIEFYITGLDAKFNLADLKLLWTVAQMCELDNPTALFFSMPALTKCMTQINSSQDVDDKLKTKLFNYRTKLQNENDDKKGMDSTISLEKGQKLRIILPGFGVFTSKILNNGKEMICTVPRQKDMIPIGAQEWVGKTINVYLWKKGDARYVFDTVVTGHGLFVGESSISLAHSTNLIRTQKRKAVRVQCEIKANLFIIKSNVVDYAAVETQGGYKCLIEDISEAGAQIRIGGKGVPNVQIKLQFTIQNMLILMFGVIRTVEYNEKLNESILHFECIHIDPAMKNEVLSYVYNILPESEKEVYVALSMTDEDELSDDSISKTEDAPTELTREEAHAIKEKIMSQNANSAVNLDEELPDIENLQEKPKEMSEVAEPDNFKID